MTRYFPDGEAFEFADPAQPYDPRESAQRAYQLALHIERAELLREVKEIDQHLAKVTP